MQAKAPGQLLFDTFSRSAQRTAWLIEVSEKSSRRSRQGDRLRRTWKPLVKDTVLILSTL